MGATLQMLRAERRARIFFLTLAQSSIGTGAGYIALLILAFDRQASPWAISLVLAAELLPAMALGPVFGAAADRWSRRACCIAADLVRGVAFVGIALVPSFGAMLGFALLAGCGTALFTPAALSALPSLVEKERLPAATAVFGAIADLGFTAGPALAAVALLFADAQAILLVNGVTFGLSAAVLSVLAFGGVTSTDRGRAGARLLLREAREGMRMLAGLPVVRIVLVASGAGLFCAGLFNVAELPFVEEELGASEATFSLLAALFGGGFIAGSLAGSSGGSVDRLERRYLVGLFLMAVGLVGLGIAQSVYTAAAAFVVAGVGNGLMLVHERLLIQTLIPDTVVGRIYGLKDSVTAWAFALSFLLAGGLIALMGVRTTIVAAGVVAFCTWTVSAVLLRRSSPARPRTRPATARVV